MIDDLIAEWIKGILIDGIKGNLSGLFGTVNTKVGEIASDVGSTPQDWNGGIFSMLQSLSETVIVPIAAAILALVMCYELIEMIVEKNNMHDFDSSMFFRWMFKSAFAILIVTNTWNIVMGVFDATQANAEWRGMGQNYLKSLLALGFQAFLIMVVVGIYAVLIQDIGTADDISGAIWGCMGYTVLLCYGLFKTGSLSKAVFTAH